MTWSELKRNYINSLISLSYKRKAIKHLKKAKKLIRKDSAISRAHVRMADAYYERSKELDKLILVENKSGQSPRGG